MATKSKPKSEYGDFQTPNELALQAVSIIRKLGIEPCSIVEPTCGKGSFLLASAQIFPSAGNYVGIDISPEYLRLLESQISHLNLGTRIRLTCADFFLLDWSTIFDNLPSPTLIVGNPPWVTSSELGSLESNNLPLKSNFQKRRGYDAITGKSNFDISEWMILKYFDWLKNRPGIIAVLCKTAVARKILYHAWSKKLPISLSRQYIIDAERFFDASVEACFMVIDMLQGERSTDCLIYESLESPKPSHTIGFHEGIVLTDVDLYKKWSHLRATNHLYKWRSGIKHDCAKVMEIERIGAGYTNAYQEVFNLESKYVYPMLKSSDIGNGQIRYGRKFMLVTQEYVGQDTGVIQKTAPQTWRYLESHDDSFARRASSIYHNRPKYSIFGVGNYSFAPWKVAISGFYKNLTFKVIQPFEKKPVVLDDTVYFIPCWNEAEAFFIAGLLNSTPAQEFYRSMIFWSDKRPITLDVLQRLSLRQVSVELHSYETYLQFLNQRSEILERTMLSVSA